LRLWLPFQSKNIYIDILDGVYSFMTDMEAQKKGWCRDCKWDRGIHPHYLNNDKDYGAYNESWSKLCTLDFKKKFMLNLTLKDVGAY